LKELYKLSRGNELIMLATIDQSIVNGWQGFFPIKGNFVNHGKSKAQTVYESLGGSNGETEEGIGDII